MLRCPRCSLKRIVRSGHVRGQQRFQCKDCRYHFTATPRAVDGFRKLFAVELYLLGVPVGRIARVFGVSATTVTRWVHRFAEDYREPLVRRERAVLVPPKVVREHLEQRTPSSSGRLTLVVHGDWLQGETAIIARPSLHAAEPTGSQEPTSEPKLRRQRGSQEPTSEPKLRRQRKK